MLPEYLRNWRILAVVAALVACGCAIAVVCWPKSDARSPRLMAIPQELELRSIARGSATERAISLLNTARQTLHVTKTITSCGCTVAQLDKKVIAPGETARMTITLDATGLSGHLLRFA